MYFEDNIGYKALDKLGGIILNHLMLSSDAYVKMIELNMHGYKKLHRELSKKFHSLYLELQNKVIEMYNTPLESNTVYHKYEPQSLKEHLTEWNKTINEDLASISNIITTIFNGDGYICDIAEEMQQILYRNKVKNERAIQKFEDCNWSMEVIYMHDDFIHKNN